jgi:hypothetical protein
MADEANIPTHRYYKPENNIALPNNEISKTIITAAAIVKIDAQIALLAAQRA